MVGYDDNKGQLLVRLRRIEGQVRGIQRMVQEETYCIEILTQITAITGALNKVAVSPITEGRPAVGLDDGASSDLDQPDMA